MSGVPDRLDPNHTYINVGVCRHLWVVRGSGGEVYFDPRETLCPRCDDNKARVWVWTKIVGGDPKKRGAV